MWNRIKRYYCCSQMNRGDMFQNRFEIGGLLGKGGDDEVYRAFDTKMQRMVAIKLIPSAFLNPPITTSLLALLHGHAGSGRSNTCLIS